MIYIPDLKLRNDLESKKIGERVTMQKAIIFGGTGMLADVSRWLIKNYSHTSVVARDVERLKLLNNEQPENNLKLVSLDYKNVEAVQELIKNTIKIHGPMDTVIAWVHSDAPHSVIAIFNEITDNQTESFHFFHIIGSGDHLKSIQSALSVSNQCLYHQIQLGFVVEDQKSRWLTHKEISEGVISAIKRKEEKTVIGQVEPREMRP
ncbi:short-chain dehydrogenase [Halobacillus seohaensis]|uniref:Short-chain dehydrogenase n=1 Tax=Halobacillus seohaensis TaxID=447421 RepID=A0ABW2EPR4_9BACI